MKIAGKTVALVLFATAVVTLTACGTDYSTPEATTQAYAKALMAKDVDAIVECYVKDEQSKAREQFQKSSDNEKEDAKALTVTSKGSKKDGDWTIGTIEVQQEGSTSKVDMELVLVEEDGTWKVSDKQTEEYMKQKFLKDLGGE